MEVTTPQEVRLTEPAEAWIDRRRGDKLVLLGGCGEGRWRRWVMADDTAPAPRVLHVLSVSFPHVNGYTVRSHRIIQAQQRLGYQPVVVTSPFYPGHPAAIADRVIDGVPHHRVPHPVDAGERLNAAERVIATLYRLRHSGRVRRWIGGGDGDREPMGSEPPSGPAEREVRGGVASPRGSRPLESSLRAASLPLRRLAAYLGVVDRMRFAVERFEEAWLLRRFEVAIRRLAAAEGIALLHAHSPFRCALPTLRAGRALGLPVVYEVRGVWEESAVASGYFARGDRRYRHWRRREDLAMAQADAVVCICEELRKEVVRRGVRAERVFVVPNAADPVQAGATAGNAAGPRPDASATNDHGGPLTIGYVGSLRAMEGVDELVRCVAELRRRGGDVRLLVVGGGTALAELRGLAADLGLGDCAEFTGPVPHHEVWSHYQRIDVFAITRPDTPVTRLVTPLKPLEAMAMGKAMVVSDLPALREIVDDGITGLLYTPGNVRELADHCLRLLGDPELRGRLAEAGRQWVLHHRTWPAVLAALPRIYAAVGAAPRPSNR